MKITRRMLTSILAANSILVSFAVLAAGCQPSITPEQRVEAARTALRCRRCLENNCATEANACEADATPAVGEAGNRCLCDLGCRIQHYSASQCAAHCGKDDAAYTTLSSCIDTNCPNTACPKEP
jgi:hypothetical protein